MNDTTATGSAATTPVRDMDWLIAMLKPFAEVADQYHPTDDGQHEVWIDAGPERIIRGSFKLANYRGAREAMIELDRVKAAAIPKPADAVRALIERLPPPDDRTEYGQGAASGINRAAEELDRREALADLKSPDRRGAAMRLAFALGKFAARWEAETIAYPGTGQSDIDVAIVMDAIKACGLVGVEADPGEIYRSVDENGRTTSDMATFSEWIETPTFQAITHGNYAVVVVPYDPRLPDAANRLLRNTDGEIDICIVRITPPVEP